MVLKRRNIYDEVVAEINEGDNLNPMELDEGDGKRDQDQFFSNSGPGILEEYLLKVQEQKKELQETKT